VIRSNPGLSFCHRNHPAVEIATVDRNDPICEIVARKVIEIDVAGTHNPEEIAKLAVKQLGLP
jgi:hypothetical protein